MWHFVALMGKASRSALLPLEPNRFRREPCARLDLPRWGPSRVRARLSRVWGLRRGLVAVAPALRSRPWGRALTQPHDSGVQGPDWLRQVPILGARSLLASKQPRASANRLQGPAGSRRLAGLVGRSLEFLRPCLEVAAPPARSIESKP